MKIYSNATRKLLVVILVAPFLFVVILVLGYKSLFIAEDITSGSAYSFSIGESYEAVYIKSKTIKDVKINEYESVLTIDYGGEWYINRLRLVFSSGELAKMERRRALFELP